MATPSFHHLAVLFVALSLPALARADAADDLVRTEMARQHIPGLTLGIVREGRLISTRAYGFSDLELGVRTTGEDAFEIGSITKSFTAIAAMTLVEEGKLGLDDPISRYLPESPETWASITVRNLLYQTSGLKDYALIPGIGLVDRFDRPKWMEEMTKLPLDFAPGATWAYSNSNYALMGWIIEKAAGRPYPEVVTERLLKPAGMSRTVFGDPEAIIPRRSHGYFFQGDRQTRSPYGSASIASDGSLLSTIGDMAKWDAAVRAGKFLSPTGWKAIWTPARLASGRERAYGMGWNLALPFDPVPYVGHGGNSAGYSAGYARYPRKGLSVIVLCNLYPVSGEPLARRIAETIDPSLAMPSPTSVADPDPRRTERVRSALAAFGARDVDSDLLDAEMTASLKTQRAIQAPAAKGPNPLADFDEALFAGGTPVPGGTWLTYRLRRENRWTTARVLWTPEGRVAQLVLRPEAGKIAPKTPRTAPKSVPR